MKKAKTQHESIQGGTRTQNLSVITREESVVEDISRHQLQSHNQTYLVASFCSNVHVYALLCFNEITLFPNYGLKRVFIHLQYTFCCSLRGNTHSFALRGKQLRQNTIIRDKKPSFAGKSDSLTIFAF